MIRATDFVTTSAWIRPASAPAASDGVDSTQWFNADEPQAGPAISGDLAPSSRGLTADQHARRVLSYLQDTPPGSQV
jgi:hypothetical protein